VMPGRMTRFRIGSPKWPGTSRRSKRHRQMTGFGPGDMAQEDASYPPRLDVSMRCCRLAGGAKTTRASPGLGESQPTGNAG